MVVLVFRGDFWASTERESPNKNYWYLKYDISQLPAANTITITHTNNHLSHTYIHTPTHTHTHTHTLLGPYRPTVPVYMTRRRHVGLPCFHHTVLKSPIHSCLVLRAEYLPSAEPVGVLVFRFSRLPRRRLPTSCDVTSSELIVKTAILWPPLSVVCSSRFERFLTTFWWQPFTWKCSVIRRVPCILYIESIHIGGSRVDGMSVRAIYLKNTERPF